jgi:ABC-2 type transport system permease protein
VAAKKLRADTTGAEKEIPVADWVTIGVFGGETSAGDRLGKLLYTGRHRLTSAMQTVEVVVAEPPRRAAVDPYHLLVDRAPKDNVKEIDSGT